MHTRGAFRVAAALAFLAAPVASHADPSSAAVDVCVKSFVDAYLSKDRIVQVIKPSDPVDVFDYVYAPETYTIALTAREVRSGDVLAQARCIASRRGKVTVLDSPPIDSYLSKADIRVTVGG